MFLSDGTMLLPTLVVTGIVLAPQIISELCDQKSQDIGMGDFGRMAHPERFELPTNRFEAGYSIH